MGLPCAQIHGFFRGLNVSTISRIFIWFSVWPTMIAVLQALSARMAYTLRVRSFSSRLWSSSKLSLFARLQSRS